MSALEWAGFAVADLALVGGLAVVLGWAYREWRSVVDNWTDDND